MSLEAAGRKLLRIEARNAQTPIERKQIGRAHV